MEETTGPRPHAPTHKWRWILPLAALGLMLAWLAAGTWLAPVLIRSMATDWVATRLHKQLALGAIHFDPLRFTLDIDRIAIADRAGARPMVALGHLGVGVAPLSGLGGEWRLTELRLDAPAINAVLRRDGSLNLAELIPPAQGGSTGTTALAIDRLAITGGTLSFLDQSLPGSPHARLAPVNLALSDIHTSRGPDGHLAFSATSQKGEQLALHAALGLAPLAARGDFALAGLRADTLAPFLAGQLPVALGSGRADVAGRFDFAHGPAGLKLDSTLSKAELSDVGLAGGLLKGRLHLASLAVEGGEIHLAGPGWAPTRMSLAARGAVLKDARLEAPALGAGRALRLGEARLEGLHVDLAGHNADLGSLTLAGLDVPLRRAADGSINLMALVPATAASAPASASTPASPWHAHLAHFALANAAVHVEDRAVQPASRLEASALSLAIEHIDTDLSRPLPLRFALRLNGAATLSGSGTLTPATTAGTLQLALTGLPLATIMPYLAGLPPLDLRSGTLAAAGRLSLAGSGLQGLRFAGSAGLDHLAVYEKGATSPLVAWNALALAGLAYGPQGVDIASARLQGVAGHIAIMADKSFNFAPLMATPGAPPVAAPPAASGRPAAAAPAPAPAPAPATSAPAMPIRLHRLMLAGGTLDFADYSITPSFAATISALSGQISNITNAPGAIAAINLQGQVIDRYAPVSVTGTADLFHYDRATDIKLTFSNIELPIFNPYSDVYAGYAIAKGKLSTAFTYHIANRALAAEHHIVIDQLQWGQASASKARVPWPVRLATSLLKDRHGVIRLDVPVRGTLDDPTFRLGPIIWKIIGNVLEKAVTAPFRLIGSLFAGAEKAQFVDFAPGSAQLPAGASESLAALA
ncbi:MAG TPA: DUF748 domain-containing protein, partial [Novosphingobium sp.]|nr:DUF748 domain-containing protein [Novosphingobium sp.]